MLTGSKLCFTINRLSYHTTGWLLLDLLFTFTYLWSMRNVLRPASLLPWAENSLVGVVLVSGLTDSGVYTRGAWKIALFSYVTPCSLVHIYWSFEGTQFLPHRGRRFGTHWADYAAGDWGNMLLQKCHGVISQKKVLFAGSAVWPSWPECEGFRKLVCLTAQWNTSNIDRGRRSLNVQCNWYF